MFPTNLGATVLPFRTLDPQLAVIPWDGRATVYITANPVSVHLLARANNSLRGHARETTTDRAGRVLELAALTTASRRPERQLPPPSVEQDGVRWCGGLSKRAG